MSPGGFFILTRRSLGCSACSRNVEGEPITSFIPEMEWLKISQLDNTGGQGVVRARI